MGSLGPVSPSVATTPRQPRALVVFDYDCSLANDDSDALFCKALCPDLLARLDTPSHTPPPLGWPAMMDAIFTEFFEKHPQTTQHDVVRALAEISVFPEMLDAVRLAADEYNATVAIISDANTLFIESMLDHHMLRDRVKEIHTNRGVWETSETQANRLRVQPYHGVDQDPHGCAWCPSNMCKGRILDALRDKTEYDVVLYVGDGIGDFCPSTRLSSRDTVFARANDVDGKSYGLLHRIQSNADKVHARVVPWSTGTDVYTGFQETLQSLHAE